MSFHRRAPWSQAEDSYLAQLVQTQGAMNWVRIAQLIGSRSPKQCRERYHQNLKPSLNHEPISPEEGLQIERMVGEMGKRWAEISRRLNGRSDIAVKNWWNGSMNRRRRLVVQRRSQDVYTVSPATANNNHNTQNTIKTPIGYSTYSTTYLPAQWPPDNRWEARMPAEMNEISGELSASTSNNDPPKFLNTRPDQISLPPLRQYMRTPWNGPHMSVDVNDEAAAESHEHLHDNFTVFSKDSGYKSAKSMPNSNASTSKGSQPVSRNTRNGVNDSQPLGAGQAEGEPRKSLSDTSHDSGFSGTTLSGLGETKVKGAPQELAEILANHLELRPLILQATEEMDPRRFDKVFIRLLKTCAIDLRGEAKTPLEKGAVRIIYNYRAYATSLIRDEFTSRGHEKVSAMNRLKFQKVEDKMKLEIFIENYQQKSTEKQDIQMNEDDEEDDKLSMGSDYNDPDEPDLRNLRKVRGFITSSAAFSNLKSNLEDFLIPTSDGSKPVIATLQTCMEDIQWHPATADRRSSTKRKSPENEEEMSHQVKWPKLDESNDEKNPFTLDADGEGADVEGDTLVKYRPVTRNGHRFIFHARPDPKYHPQPSGLPVLTTSHHFSIEQETANELHDMGVLGAPTLSTAGNGKVEPAFVDNVSEERARVLQTNLQACSSSMGAHNLNIHRPALAIDNFSQIEDENCSFQGSTLQYPAKTITDGQLIQHRSSSSTSQKMWGLLKRRWRPLLRPGHRRLEWVCVSHTRDSYLKRTEPQFSARDVEIVYTQVFKTTADQHLPSYLRF
jgi:Myb-like DNA-binding protein FlbD